MASSAGAEDLPRTSSGGYAPLGRRASWAKRLLVAAVVLDAVALPAGLSEYRLLERAASPEGITTAEADANDLLQAVIAVGQVALFVLAAVFFLRWFHRAYKNLPARSAWASCVTGRAGRSAPGSSRS